MAFAAARENPMADINVTPLVDVMLVLLIIFMITAPALSRTLAMDLPQPGPESKPLTELTLEVQAGDMYVLEGQAMSRAQITQALISAKAANPDLKVTLDVDAEADYESAMRGMAAVRNAGIAAIGLPAQD